MPDLFEVMYSRGFLHDGRVSTLDEAILWHGGEATGSLNSYMDLKDSDKSSLIHFLESL